jgi:hypothetical protein
MTKEPSDLDLQTLFATAMEEAPAPEKVKPLIQAQVEKLIEETIKTSMRSWGEVGKSIEVAVQEAMKVQNLSLPSYGSMVSAMVAQQIEERASELVAGRLKKDIEELLNLTPKKIRLSEIAAEMLEGNSCDYQYTPLITVIAEEWGGGWCVYLDENEHFDEGEKYRSSVRIIVNKDGFIVSGTTSDYKGTNDLKRSKDFGRCYMLDQKVRSWYACQTQIEIDIDDCILEKGD